VTNPKAGADGDGWWVVGGGWWLVAVGGRWVQRGGWCYPATADKLLATERARWGSVKVKQM